MKFLAYSKLSEHRYKTPEGYLVCVDSVLSRTGKQTYTRDEIFKDGDESEISVNRSSDEVFNEKTLASFENKPLTIEHPDEDVNPSNYNKYSVGFVRDIKKGVDNGEDVMLGTIVITDEEAINLVEDGKYKELSCGYDCDILDEDSPQQRNIRGNHVALCEHGRAGIARIVDSNTKDDDVLKVRAAMEKYSKLLSISINEVNDLADDIAWSGSITYLDAIDFYNQYYRRKHSLSRRGINSFEEYLEAIVDENKDTRDKSASKLLKLHDLKFIIRLLETKKLTYEIVDDIYDNLAFRTSARHKIVNDSTKYEKAAVIKLSNSVARDIEFDEDPSWFVNNYNLNIDNHSDSFGYEISGSYNDLKQFISDYNLQDNNIRITYKDSDDTDELYGNSDIIKIVSELIQDEWEAVTGYADAIDKIKKSNLPDKLKNAVTRVISDITNEENTHIGQLEKAIQEFIPEFNVEQIKGMKEGETQMKDTKIDDYNKYEHETDINFIEESIKEMNRYISNWSFMSTKEKRDIGTLAELNKDIKNAKNRLKELKSEKDSVHDTKLAYKDRKTISTYLASVSRFHHKDMDIMNVIKPIEELGYKLTRQRIDGWNKMDDGMMRKDYFFTVDGYNNTIMFSLYADPNDWEVHEVNAYFTDSVHDKSELNKNKIKRDLLSEIKKYYNHIYDPEMMSYTFVDIDEDNEKMVIHVRTELDYEELINLSDKLDAVLRKYDNDAYFEPETSGILVAYIWKSITDSVSDSNNKIKDDDTMIISKLKQLINSLNGKIVSTVNGTKHYKDTIMFKIEIPFTDAANAWKKVDSAFSKFENQYETNDVSLMHDFSIDTSRHVVKGWFAIDTSNNTKDSVKDEKISKIMKIVKSVQDYKAKDSVNTKIKDDNTYAQTLVVYDVPTEYWRDLEIDAKRLNLILRKKVGKNLYFRPTGNCKNPKLAYDTFIKTYEFDKDQYDFIEHSTADSVKDSTESEIKNAYSSHDYDKTASLLQELCDNKNINYGGEVEAHGDTIYVDIENKHVSKFKNILRTIGLRFSTDDYDDDFTTFEI